ncbi:Fic family protein [Ilyomonas limi]|uniref:Fic family protein n=1 Tax=Ilyomonas limi TaxID=2575867 RepID=A0A4U3KV56_9BACT|nr:Fic family protein [Ilyomonas limi]TKK66351.1 Fic family protein [Ilyomonas limi]
MIYPEKRQQVDELQQKINAYGELRATVKKKINYKFRLDWNYYSNSMEGNTLTMEETRSVMVGNLTVGGKPIKDVLEIKGHDEVISEILRIGKSEVRLSERRIRDIHKGIMYEENETEREKIGKWKTEPNYVINYKGERFDFAPPADVPELMHELLNRTNAAIDAIQQGKKDAPHPLDVALQFHLDYVLIHPFYDGNGRTARILTNLLLISFGYPPFWINTGERKIYNQYIADIQGYGGSPDLFYDFAAGLVLRSQQIILDAINGKSIEEDDDTDKQIELFKRSLSKKNESNKIRALEHIHSILTHSGVYLIERLIKTLSRFNDLFHKTETRFIFSNQEGKFYDIRKRMEGYMRAIDEQFPDSFVNWIEKKGNLDFISFGIEFYWEGYKLSTPPFNVGVYVYFRFDNYSYQILRDTTFNDTDNYFECSYEEQLAKEDINLIVSKVANDIINEIKEKHLEF